MLETTLKPWRAYTNVRKIRLNYLLGRKHIHALPVAAYLDPVQSCPPRRPECSTGMRLNLRPAAKVDMDLYRSILDDIGDCLFSLKLYNWGDPLPHAHLPEMIGGIAGNAFAENSMMNSETPYPHAVESARAIKPGETICNYCPQPSARAHE